MKLLHVLSISAAVALAACGGGEQGDDVPESPATSTPAGGGRAAAPTPPTGPMTIPDWFAVDNDARTVRMNVTAGLTPDNNYWNFNGATHGSMAVTVPEGYRVIVEFTNRDPNMAHSFGVSTETRNFAMPPAAVPVFEGAISQNPGSLMDSTMPGESETIEFVAEREGDYSIVCYVPGHSAVGMWIYFNVSDEGQAGVQTR